MGSRAWLRLASELGNLSRACRSIGYSRAQFYKIRRNYQAHGATGLMVAMDIFMVGHLKGVGRVYLQSVIGCHCRHAWGRLYTSKLPLTAVHVLNEDVLPFLEQHGLPVKTILSDNGRGFRGRPDRHPYELFLQLEDIEPPRHAGAPAPGQRFRGAPAPRAAG